MPNYINVSELNQYIAQLFEYDEILHNFWLKGEIIGFKRYQQSGHLYFNLKDKQSMVSCVMFRSRARGLRFIPEDGMEVLVRGSVALYARQGRYQVYVEEMQPFGLGEIYQQLEKLKSRLAKAGYFDPEHKQELPRMARRIGVVSSQDGAALRDILRILKQRDPGVEVVFAHSSVQGVEAPAELAQAVAMLNEYGQVDIIIVGRGGGSLEDLMAFNSEEVVRAIYESDIPVISAVGHEVDVTLSDLAADARAATPTQAAQMAVPELSRLQSDLQQMNERLQFLMEQFLAAQQESLDRMMRHPLWREPAILLQQQADQLSRYQDALKQSMQLYYKERWHELTLAAQALDRLSPLQVLARGYAILSRGEHVVRSVQELEIGDKIEAVLRDGILKLTVEGKEGGEHGTDQL